MIFWEAVDELASITHFLLPLLILLPWPQQAILLPNSLSPGGAGLLNNLSEPFTTKEPTQQPE